MFLFKHGHPLKKVRRQLNDLKVAMDRALPKRRTRSGYQFRGASQLRRLEASLGSLASSIYQEFNDWSIDGETSRSSIESIRFCFFRFTRDLEDTLEWLAALEPCAEHRLKGVVRATNRLSRAIRGLTRAVDSGRFRVVDHHTECPEEFLKIRKVLSKLNPEVAGAMKSADVDTWCRWPGLDPDDKDQVLAVAKLVLVNLEPDQCFGLSFRSRAPGRPLLPMAQCGSFPTLEEVLFFAEEYKFPDRIYVTASKPTWRIVWTFHQETVGW